MTDATLRVMSYNTLFGGFDGADDRRHCAQLEIVRATDPDILLLQEAKGFTAAGGRLLHEVERAVGMRGFVAEAPVTGQNTAILIKAHLSPLSFTADADHFHHAAAFLRVEVPGLPRPLTVASLHLCPNSPEIRLREAAYLFNLADPADAVLVAGDFNSVSPDDPEPEGMGELPARFRSRYCDEAGCADRRVVASLLRAGFVDVAVKLSRNGVPTVPGAGFKDTEFMPFRSDYVLATPALASRATRYEVVRTVDTDSASDHYPIVAEIGL